MSSIWPSRLFYARLLCSLPCKNACYHSQNIFTFEDSLKTNFVRHAEVNSKRHFTFVFRSASPFINFSIMVIGRKYVGHNVPIIINQLLFVTTNDLQKAPARCEEESSVSTLGGFTLFPPLIHGRKTHPTVFWNVAGHTHSNFQWYPVLCTYHTYQPTRWCNFTCCITEFSKDATASK